MPEENPVKIADTSQEFKDIETKMNADFDRIVQEQNAELQALRPQKIEVVSQKVDDQVNVLPGPKSRLFQSLYRQMEDTNAFRGGAELGARQPETQSGAVNMATLASVIRRVDTQV